MAPFLKYALPALAMATAAFAAPPCDEDFTIKSSGDASSLDCESFEGNLTIDPETGDDIAIDGIQEIKGDFIVDANSAVRRISGLNLQTVTGEMRFNDVSQLASLSFPKLTKVDKLTMLGLANLRALGFDAQISECSNLRIENTQLQNLKGINLTEVGTLLVASNDAISLIDMQITNVTSLLEISNNNADLTVSFPHLVSANNMTFRACANISIPSLEQLNAGSLGIYSGKLESFAAPNLTKIDAALTIAENENLVNISFPLLKSVGGSLQIANNTNLREIVNFDELTDVGAALDLSGNLTKVETPKINFVKGVFNLQSTGSLGGTCKDFYDPLKDKSKLGPKNKYRCQDSLQQAGTADSTPTGGSSKPTGAAPSINVQNTYLGLAGLAAVFFV